MSPWEAAAISLISTTAVKEEAQQEQVEEQDGQEEQERDPIVMTRPITMAAIVHILYMDYDYHHDG